MRRLIAWALGLAFAGGLLGPDAVGVLFTALAAFVLAFALRRAPWRWALVSLTAWATGAAIGALLTVLGGGSDFAPPGQAGAGVVVVTAYASAFAGAWLSWVASRVVQQR